MAVARPSLLTKRNRGRRLQLRNVKQRRRKRRCGDTWKSLNARKRRYRRGLPPKRTHAGNKKLKRTGLGSRKKKKNDLLRKSARRKN